MELINEGVVVNLLKSYGDSRAPYRWNNDMLKRKIMKLRTTINLY